MNQEQFVSHVRGLLKIVGTYLVAQGTLSDSTWVEVSGWAVTVAGFAWSHWHHRRDRTAS